MCRPIKVYQLHGGSYCLPLQGRKISETSKHIFLDPEVGVVAYMSERSVNMHKTTRHIPQDTALEIRRASGVVGKLTDRVSSVSLCFSIVYDRS